MCLVTRQIKPITTKKDLVVFKDVRINSEGKVNSHYFHFDWDKKVLNKTELNIQRKYPFDSGRWNGTMCPYFDRKSHAFYVKDKRKYTVVKEGFHATLTKRRLIQPHYSKVKFLIPKGSLVFMDATGLIVSNQIMML